MKISKIISFFAAIAPVISLYLAPSTNTPLIIAFLYLTIMLTIDKRKSGLVSKKFLWYLIVVLFIELVSYFLHRGSNWYSSSAVKNNILFTTIPIFLCIWRYMDRLDIKYFIKIVTFFATFASIIIVYQRISYIITGGYFANWYIPGMELVRDDLGLATDRPSAFFSEPSHFSEYLLPITLYYFLKKRWPLAILYTFSILCSGSTNGLVGLMVVLFMTFVWNKNKSFKTYLILGAMVIIMLVINVVFSDIMSGQVSKLTEVDVETNTRLLGNIAIFDVFDNQEWLFGIGMGNKDEVFWIAGLTADLYLNTYLGELVHHGIIGLSSYIILIIYLYKKCCVGTTRAFLILFIVLGLSCFFTNNVELIIYMIFIVNTKKLFPELSI